MSRPLCFIFLMFSVLAGPLNAAEPSALCADIASPGLLGGGSKGEDLCNWFDAKAVLVVNTASQCGYTPQFKDLEVLHKKYAAQGLVVLGFPSDNFGGQEFADPSKTADVCYRNYGVSFPMFSKVDVIGADAYTLFKRLSAASEAPAWNFHKYLIVGNQVTAFRSSVKPNDADIAKLIEQAIAATP